MIDDEAVYNEIICVKLQPASWYLVQSPGNNMQ